MILSDLVKDDPRGFVDLDRNLGRHIGEQNVEAFHVEAGDVVIEAMTDDPELFGLLMEDEVVVAELAGALDVVNARAIGLSAGGPAKSDILSAQLKDMSRNFQQDGLARSFIHGEILSNGMINDRAMRNPKVMSILANKVGELYKAKGGATKR